MIRFPRPSLEICIRPSTPGISVTKAPNLVRRTTVPVKEAPSGNSFSTRSQGSGSFYFRLRDIRLFSQSSLRMTASTSWPTLIRSEISATCSHAISEMGMSA